MTRVTLAPGREDLIQEGVIVAGEHLQVQARRVVTGVNEAGESIIVSDANTPVRQAAEGFTVCDIWRVDGLPTHVAHDDASSETVVLDPPPAGFVYRVTTFAPDREWDPAAGYAGSLEALGGGETAIDHDSSVAGLHQTDTVDIVTVLTGELYAVIEGSETLLRPGDSMVTRGDMHTWSNRTDKPATIVAVQMAATR